MRRRTSAGSCEKSQSISRIRSAEPPSARRKPARYAGPRPSLWGRCRTETPSSSAASASAISPVPSGELSSITSTWTPRPCSVRTIRSTFSRSLYVGRQTVARKAPHIIVGMATTLPRNSDVADQLDLLADLSEIRGDDSFRVSAYRSAATRVRETAAPVAELAVAGRAKEQQGIGKTIEGKIIEIVRDGEIHALTRRKSEIPGELVLFMRLPGLGPKSARKIWKELGITTVDGLKAAAVAQQLRGHAGIGAGTEEKIATALAKPQAAQGPRRSLLGTTLPKLRAVVEELREHPASVEVSLAGSAGRMRETVRDLDIIVTAREP